MKNRFMLLMLTASLLTGQMSAPVIAYAADIENTAIVPAQENPTTEEDENTEDEVPEEALEEIAEEEMSEEPEKDLDYVLGRPLTEAEIEEQKAMVPDQPSMPDVGYEPEDAGSEFQLWSATASESYDSRLYGLVTPVKNQNPFGTCWAFSALSAAETSMLNQNSELSTPDYSELQLAYYFYNRNDDELGNTTGDKNQLLSSTYMNIGGNHYLTSWELASWIGAVNESDAPYPTSPSSVPSSLDGQYEYSSNQSVLKNALFISSSNQDAMKTAIQTYGSLAISYYMNTNYWNPNTNAYCYQGELNYNHAVTIVGWDDTYSASNFVDTPTPPTSDGAWIVKNSYGSRWGNMDGYFYLSYEDTSIACPTVFDMQSADTYDHNYQYDGTAGMSTVGMSKGIEFSNVYTTKGNEGEKDEILSAVGLGMASSNTNYSIQIYTNLSDESDPTSGTPAFEEPQTGRTSVSGYYTVELEQPITLNSQETFAVVVTLPNGGNMFVEKNDRISGWVEFKAHMAQGQSFWRTTGEDWADAYADAPETSDRFCARIKAFTTDSDTSTLPALEMSETTKNMNVGETGSLSVKTTPKMELTYEWSSDDTNVVTVDNGAITAVGSGTATITAKYKSRMVHCVVTVNHQIRYHMNGGINAASNPNQYLGEAVTLTTPSRNGYDFVGWYTDSDYMNQVSELAANVWQDYDLYALWGRWQTDNGVRHYYLNDDYLRNTSYTINGITYQFDENGEIRKGWVHAAEGWYYYNMTTGARQTGWLRTGGEWFYLDGRNQGLMSVGFVQVGSSTYYMKTSGEMVTGWRAVSGTWYYFKSSGAMTKGWFKEGKIWYYLNTDNGAMAKGWLKVGKTWYYMNGSGAMITGWRKVGGLWYYMKSSGAMATGWLKIGSTWYYLKGSGAMATGWITLYGKTYYLKSGGAMATGGLRINNAYYYFDKNGVLRR